MSFGRQTPYRRGSSGPPAWLIFLVGIALVFGLYYLWLGVQNFLRTGGGGVVESTERAQILATSTAEAVIPTHTIITPTPIPECQDFIVTVPSANVRKTPDQSAPVLKVFKQDETVCVLGRPDPNSEWYTIDLLPESRRLELAYMHQSVIEAAHPTPTPSNTPTPLPTITATPSPTLTQTPVPRPTETRDPHATDIPLPSITPSPTAPRQSA